MKLNATQKMGEIRVELLVAELKGSGALLPDGGKCELFVLSEAGVSAEFFAA